MSIPKKRRTQTQRGQGHYFDPEPAAPSRPRIITLVLKDVTLRLQTDSAVFSAERVDPGTQVLLAEAPPPPAHGELLDLGCGYGAVALTLATRAPQARVWAVDVNQRALELTRLNAETAGLRNVVVCHPQEVPADLRFAAIYSNPPVRVGKSALHDLLLSWLPRVEPGGAAYLVVQSHLGSDSLARWLVTQGYQVRRLTSKRSYRVLEVRRQTS
jgi:16S rRNA (guanine1207-N2)-methyltransferase